MVEIIEIKVTKIYYCTDFWNWFDLLRLIGTVFYFVIVLTDTFGERTQLFFLTAVNAFQSFKLVSIFTLFRATRVLVRSLVNILKDMIPFLLFCTAAIAFFSLMYTSTVIENDLDNFTYQAFLLHVFELSFGGFATSDYGRTEIIVFLIAAFLLPLVMLNMLIAIMGDTYDGVKEKEDRRDLQELSNLIFKY